VSDNFQIPRFAYEPTIKITTDSEEYEYKDVNNFAIYRHPFIKTSSFSSLTLAVDLDVYQFLDDSIRRNKFPTLSLKMNLAANENNERENERTYKSKAGGFNNNYKILKIQAREESNVNTQLIPITLYLANSSLYELTQSKSYNKLIANNTANKILKDYESHLSSTYSNGFKFKQFISNSNDFTYKQLLIRTENDAMVPQWIVNNAKPSNDLTYYFFDDFIPLPDYGLINGLLISLSKENIKKFELIDITEDKYSDIKLNSQSLRQQSMSDIGGILLAENPTLVITDKSNRVICTKGSSTPLNKTSTGGSASDNLMGRDVKNQEYGTSSTTNVKAHGLNLYACDTVDNAKKRFDNISKLIRTDIEYISTYETREIHYDIMQFFRAYNMTPESEIEYRYVPISIVNIFSKYSKRETTMRHGAKFQFLVYKMS